MAKICNNGHFKLSLTARQKVIIAFSGVNYPSNDNEHYDRAVTKTIFIRHKKLGDYICVVADVVHDIDSWLIGSFSYRHGSGKKK
jgi:hypothetical protein